MNTRTSLATALALALALPNLQCGPARSAGPPRPEGPCDIYAAAGAPCVGAHSSTRALLASYDGPLYQVMRQSDGRTLDIGVVQPSASPVPDAGGYADAAAQDRFCANTYCWITTLYDQSGQGNHLQQAPRGAFVGASLGGFNNLPIADMAPITLMGHKVYGVFIAPGMGLRWNDPKGTAVDDQAEGQYWVINGHHYNSGCCFDYGNAETDSRDDGDGTMETTYYGNATLWYYGAGPGPWIMTDQENNLVGCVNESPDDKYCPDLPSIDWRFVTATADGEPNHWRTLGGDAQQGELEIMFEGTRVTNDRSSYDPMRKQGAIVLGNGGDNNNYSQGTFYEGAMTAPGTFPSIDTNQSIQANIVAARYDVPRLSIAPAVAADAPPGLQTFSPGSPQNTTVTFTNTTGAPATSVELSIATPRGWTSTVVAGSSDTFTSVAPGASVSATFAITPGSAAFNGDLVGNASWTNETTGRTQSEIAVEKVRNTSPVKINEFRVSAGSNDTDSYIELFNAGEAAVDISGWTLTQHQTQLPVFSSVTIPSGTRLAPGGFYLLGLATSGLAVPGRRGDTTIYVRSTEGMAVGDEIQIGTGSAAETHRIASVGTAAGLPAVTAQGLGFGRSYIPGGPTTLWQPLPEGPVITIPAGSTNVPVAGVAGFEVGQQLAIGHGATYPTVGNTIEQYEVVTVTEVGKPGTQAWLAVDAKQGDTNIKVSSTADISVGDSIRLDIDSEGHGIEWVTVTRVGTPAARRPSAGPFSEGEDPGTGLDLAEPLEFDHAANMPFSARGTGISFTPATRFAHSSNEPVLPLGTGITLDQPLSRDYAIDAVVRDPNVTTAGYQGAPEPDQWFGGPALSASAGNLVLRDAAGLVVESLNYGSLVDPWAAEGYQGTSGAGYQSGCSVSSPGNPPSRFGPADPAAALPNRSAGRFPDGHDTDSNCDDFQVQPFATLAAAAAAGGNNIKVSNVAGFAAGQNIVIGAGANLERAVIATVGTAGASTLQSATQAGTTVIPVASTDGFSTGQTITIGSGANQETAVVARTRRGGFGGAQGQTGPTINLRAPLTRAHGAAAQVSGTGITLTAGLTRAHEAGAAVTDNPPTPGASNQYQPGPRS